MSVLSLGKLSLGKDGARKNPVVQTHLLPQAFKGFAGNDCIHVLDAGVGKPGTLEFLNQFPVKIYFLDLSAAIYKDADVEAIASALDDYHDVVFDVCLLWDVLHRLDGPQLATLSMTLEPHIYSETKMHSICQFAAPDEVCDFRIQGTEQFESIRTKPRKYQKWSYTQFTKLFPCARIMADQQFPDGRLEMLLTTE